MSKTDNIEVLRGLYAEAQEKLRAMLPILAGELGVPVGPVAVSCLVMQSHDSGFIHGPQLICETFNVVGVEPKPLTVAINELRQKLIDAAFAESESKEANDGNA